MEIAVYTLTRDRLDYTKYCFQTLKDKAGYPYDHFIIDNGSQDGTVDWLKDQESNFRHIRYNAKNLGISVASNQALDTIGNKDYDLIIKFDNDCEVVSDNILSKIIEVYKNIEPSGLDFILSPRVEGIVRQPKRAGYKDYAGSKIGFTPIVGGLFHIVPIKFYNKFRYPEDLLVGYGQDGFFCNWVKKSMGGKTGYIEDLVVRHYETTNGQLLRYPEYFKRKMKEKEQ